MGDKVFLKFSIVVGVKIWVEVTNGFFKGKFRLCLKWGKLVSFASKINIFKLSCLNIFDLFIRFFEIVPHNIKKWVSDCFVFLTKILIMSKMK